MKFASAIFPAILLTIASQAHAFCQIGDTQQCTVNGVPGIRQCDPRTHQFWPVLSQRSGYPEDHHRREFRASDH